MLQVLAVAVRRICLEVECVLVPSELKPLLWARQPRCVNQTVIFEKSNEHAAQYPGHGDLGDVVFSPDFVRLRSAAGRPRPFVLCPQTSIDIAVRFTTKANVRFKPLEQALESG